MAFSSGLTRSRRPAAGESADREPQPARPRTASITCCSRRTAIAGTGSAAWTICSSAARSRPRRGADRRPVMDGTAWWQTAVMYQIYPRSFQDGDGDGVGDLRGIRQRLPYLGELGVDAVWISPIFPSPMADFGYDISDYTGIDPLFGTLEEFDALLAAAHEHGLKVLLDLVPNHTSDQHPWFQDSRASRQSPMRDWYIWRDPAPDGGPPNNWRSEFGGSAWQRDERTGQYYYHAFLAAQPDLNWRNPAVRAAMHEVMRFWLRRGVDGFRVDVIWHLLKDDRFRDNPLNPGFQPGQPPHHAVIPLYTTDLPEVHEAIAGLRRVLDEFPDRVLHRRDLSADRAPRRVLRARARGHAPAVQLHAAPGAVAGPRHREAHRGLRGRAAPGRLAQLGARQPRPATHRGPRRPRAGAHRRHAAAHAEGNAHHLLWRRDRDAAGAYPARSRVRPVRAQCARTRLRAGRRPHPDAMGCLAPRRAFPR